MKRTVLLLIVFLSGFFSVNAFAQADEDMASSFDCSIRMGIFNNDTFEWNEYAGASYALSDLKENEDFSFALLAVNKTDKSLAPSVSAAVNGKELNWDSTEIDGKATHTFFGAGQMKSAGTYEVIYYINGIEVKRASFEIISGGDEPPVSLGDLMKTVAAESGPTATPEPDGAGSGTFKPGDLVKTLTAGNDGSSVPGSRVILQNAGDSFSFGCYEQDQRSGADLIEWQVLAIEDGRALVISRYALDAMRYNRSYEDTTWEASTLREWLNGEFYDSAFSADEKSRISETAVGNPDNQKYGTGGGNDTRDKIFILSIDEANQYFADNEARTCEATYYTEQNGANVNSKTNRTLWWLRSPGEDSNNAAVVYADGSIYDFGLNVDDMSCTVRPSFWLVLSDEGELPVSAEMEGTDPVYTPTRTPGPSAGPSPDDEDLAAKFDCVIQMGVYNAETDKWTEYKGSTYDIGDLSEDEGFSFALYIENKTNSPLTPTVSAFVNGEDVTWTDTVVRGRDYHRYFASDFMGGPGTYNITYYINGVDVESASIEVTASDELIAGSFDCEIVMGIYNEQTDEWESYPGSVYDLNDLNAGESFAFALQVRNRMNRAVIPAVTADVNGKELSWDNTSIDGKDDHRFFASGQMRNAGTYEVTYYINGISVQSASFDITDGNDGRLKDLYDCRVVMGIYDSDEEDWHEYSGSPYVLSDLKPNESFAFALYMRNLTRETLTPRVTAVINGEKLTWTDMDIEPHDHLSDYAEGLMDKAGTYHVEFFIDGMKAGSAVFEIVSSAARSVPGSFDALFVMGIFDSRTKSWYEYSENSYDRSDLRANEEFSFALKVTNTSADEIEPAVSYLVNEKMKQTLPPVKIKPGGSQIFYVMDEMTDDGLYDIRFFVDGAEVTHDTVEIQGEWMVDQKGDIGVLLYDAPGYDGNVLRSLLNGTMVVKLDTKIVGSVAWANVRTREGHTGWVPDSSLGKPR